MNVTIAAAQYPITAFQQFENWKQHLFEWVENAVNKGAAIVLFPEYASMELVSLFDETVRNDLKLQIDALQTLLPDFRLAHTECAKQFDCIIVAGSFPVKENGLFKNRTYVFSPKGEIGFQDKRFMTRFENESWGIIGEPEKLALFKTNWGAFGIQTCYDCEFPQGTAALCHAGASIILAPSCTETLRGATRVHVGARARALENQCYTIVAQTIGNAEWSPAVDINYGYAAFYSTPDLDFPETGILNEGKHQQEGWQIFSLELEKIDLVRASGQVFNFRDFQEANNSSAQSSINITVYDL